MLQRHISTRHALNKDEYLKRWGLRNDHPLTAPAYSECRSTLAKALGLGRKPKAAVLPTGSPKAAPTSVDVVKDAQATPARGRRSRSAAKDHYRGRRETRLVTRRDLPAHDRGRRCGLVVKHDDGRWPVDGDFRNVPTVGEIATQGQFATSSKGEGCFTIGRPDDTSPTASCIRVVVVKSRRSQ